MSSYASTFPSGPGGGTTPPAALHAGGDDGEHFLADVLDAMLEAFYAYDRALRFVRVNRAAQVRLRAAGIDPASVIGRSLLDVFPQIAGTEYDRAMRRALDERVPSRFV